MKYFSKEIFSISDVIQLDSVTSCHTEYGNTEFMNRYLQFNVANINIQNYRIFPQQILFLCYV